MPYRTNAIVGGEIYHVFNRSIAKQKIFHEARDYARILDLINFYRFFTDKLSFSKYNKKSINDQHLILQNFISNKSNLVEIYALSIMPNHMHFLVKSLSNTGLSFFMRQIQHAYSKYFNLKYDRTGSLMQDMYKAKRIQTDEEFIHLSRYVHLNHVTSYIINIQELLSYPWTSFKDYMRGESKNSIVNTKPILDIFGTPEKYKEFVFDQVDYQRELASIKHLI